MESIISNVITSQKDFRWQYEETLICVIFNENACLLKLTTEYLLESVAASDDEPRLLLLQFFRNRIPGSLLIHVWCICVLR